MKLLSYYQKIRWSYTILTSTGCSEINISLKQSQLKKIVSCVNHKLKIEILEPEEKNEVIAAYKAERQKYKKAKIKKGSGREEATLALLAKFQSKLETVKKISGDYSDEEEAPEGETEAEAAGDMSW